MNPRSLRPALVSILSVGGLFLAGLTCVEGGPLATEPPSESAQSARAAGVSSSAPSPTAEERTIKAGLYLGPSSRSACDLDRSGTLRCWGSNEHHELDQRNPLQPRMKPEPIKGLPPVAEIALGAAHTCAVLREGGVRCWGDDAALFGAAGGSGSIDVYGLGEVVEIVSGSGYSCALNAAHEVLCWGRFPGSIAAASANEPRKIEGLSATKIAGSSRALCAIRRSGAVACFGENKGSSIIPQGPALVERPTDVEKLEAAKDIAMSEDGTCAVKADRSVVCWGEKHFSGYSPWSVWGVEDSVAITGGGGHFCALSASKSIKCWGDGATGATGGSRHGYRGDLDGAFVEVKAGLDFSCARTTDASIQCWGTNTVGQLAQAFEDRVTRPVELDELGGARAIEASRDATCGILEDSRVRCVGADPRDVSPEESTRYEITSIMKADSLLMSRGFEGAEAGELGATYVACAFTDRLPTCWGKNQASHLYTQDAVTIELPSTLASMRGAKAYAFGADHACSLSDEGTVTCWGGLKKTRALPTPIAGIKGAASIALGADEGCALLGDGTAACFPLRDPIAQGGPPRFAANKVVGVRGATMIAHGRRHACAIDLRGKVSCWGAGDVGALGRDVQGVDRAASVVDGVDDATELALGDDFSCARLRDGAVSCWGKNDRGQLGDGSEGDRAKPSAVADLKDVTSVRAGAAHACALTKASKVLCWGDNRMRVVEPGSPLLSRSPKAVPLSTPATEAPRGPAITL